MNLGGPSVQDLARAGGVSVAELRAELREGVQARERLVEQNLGLVLAAAQRGRGGAARFSLAGIEGVLESVRASWRRFCGVI